MIVRAKQLYIILTLDGRKDWDSLAEAFNNWDTYISEATAQEVQLLSAFAYPLQIFSTAFMTSYEQYKPTPAVKTTLAIYFVSAQELPGCAKDSA